MDSKRAALLAMVALIAGLIPAQAATRIPPDATCDHNFYLVRRFTTGRKTSVQEPTVADGKLWLLLAYVNKSGESRQQLRIWDGSRWTTEDVPRPDEGAYFISGLDATEDGVAWLAGAHQTNETRPLVLRWDGTTWETTSVPDLGPDAPLLDIDMWSAEEGWAVGHNEVDEAEWNLTFRWNGQAWQYVDSPSRGQFNELRAVSMASPADVWAIGLGGVRRTAVRWDGSAWSRHPLPQLEDHILSPSDVDAVREKRAWIAGTWDGRRALGALLAWDGEGWTRALEKRSSGFTFFHGVDVEPGGWIVGENRSRGGVRPVALRRSSDGWLTVSADNPGRGGHLNGVVNAGGEAWATGRASSQKRGLYGTLQRACV
jgi:hypothetical protein